MFFIEQLQSIINVPIRLLHHLNKLRIRLITNINKSKLIIFTIIASQKRLVVIGKPMCADCIWGLQLNLS